MLTNVKEVDSREEEGARWPELEALRPTRW